MNADDTLASKACPKCFGSGWERNTSTGSVRRCFCQEDSRVQRLMAEAHIPARYEHADLESYKPNTELQKLALQDLERFLGQYPLIDVGLLFIGPCGVGKTHLSVALLKAVIRTCGDRGLFYDFRDLLREIQASWNAVAQASQIDILRPVLEADVLVLDELGANKPTDWVRDTVTYIINHRYNNKRLTIFTSNYLDAPDRAGDESLAERIGVRLRSRLYEMCKVVDLDGKDFRREIRQASYRF